MQFSANWGHHLEGRQSNRADGASNSNSLWADRHATRRLAPMTFPLFGHLPLELQDMVIAHCAHATRSSLSRTCHGLRARIIPSVFRGFRFNNDPAEADAQLAFIRRHAAHVRHLSFVPKPILVHPALAHICGVTGADDNYTTQRLPIPDSRSALSSMRLDVEGEDRMSLNYHPAVPEPRPGPPSSQPCSSQPLPPLVMRTKKAHLYDRHTGNYVVPAPEEAFMAYEIAFPTACQEILSGIRIHESESGADTEIYAEAVDAEAVDAEAADAEEYQGNYGEYRGGTPPWERSPRFLRFESLTFNEDPDFQLSVSVRDFDRLLGVFWKALRTNTSIRRFEFSGNADLYLHMLYARPESAPFLERVQIIRHGVGVSVPMSSGSGADGGCKGMFRIASREATRCCNRGYCMYTINPEHACGSASCPAWSARHCIPPILSLKPTNVTTAVIPKDHNQPSSGMMPSYGGLVATARVNATGKIRQDLRLKFYRERGFDDT